MVMSCGVVCGVVCGSVCVGVCGAGSVSCFAVPCPYLVCGLLSSGVSEGSGIRNFVVDCSIVVLVGVCWCVVLRKCLRARMACGDALLACSDAVSSWLFGEFPSKLTDRGLVAL